MAARAFGVAPSAAASMRRWMARPRAIPVVLAVGAFVLALLQRPGELVVDSRLELTVDPALFLDRVASVWSSTTDLGHVQSGQFIGYLFPMAPWFAGAKALGLSMWVAERLWMGALLAIAAWGAVRVMDLLYSEDRGPPHFIAGLIFAVNPYVVSFASRATVALLAHAALPWLIVAAHRGLADAGRRWRWPAVTGIALACAGGGVNAALLPWVIAAPVGLILYEWLILRARTRHDAWRFGWRAAVCALLGSVWWIVPVLFQSRYGANFLAFIEQPQTIWATSSMSESLRVLGYWIFYFWTGYGGAQQPLYESASTYLFDLPVLIATFAVPLVALGTLRWLRSWRFAPYFLGLAVFALLSMAIGFPLGKPLERALDWVYYNVPALQTLRTTYKAAPVLALALGCLGGAGAQVILRAIRNVTWPRAQARTAALVVALVVLAAIPVFYGLPFFTGVGTDTRLAYHVPRYWPQALADANRTTPAGQRLMILPGQLYPWYRWGGTGSAIGPAISKRPVVVRDVLRYADPRSSQLLASVDDLVQQGRLVSGQLVPLLRLMGIGQVLVATDGRIDQTGESSPASVSRALSAGMFAPNRATQSYGERSRFLPATGLGGPAVDLPDLRRVALPGGGPGIVRLHSASRPTVLDGDADGVATLAAVGALDPRRALFYAGDLTRQQTADQVRHGADLVLSDSNRRRIVSGVRVTEDQGPTLGSGDPIPSSLPSYDLFSRRGSPDQTVADYDNLRYLRSPGSISFTLLPQYRPFAAFDGRLDTTWLVGTADPRRGPLSVALDRPRPVSAIRVHPHADRLGYPVRLGVTINGGQERSVKTEIGWNTIPVHTVLRTLRLRVLQMGPGPFTGTGGLDEVQIPGVHTQESLRLPTRLTEQTRGLDLTHNAIDVVLQRTTADFPFQAGSNVTDAQAQNPVDAVDPEPGLRRRVTLPVARAFGLNGRATVAPGARDHLIDELVGMPRAWRFDGTNRFEGVPINRASSAFDGNPRTAWISDPSTVVQPWIQWSGPRAVRLKRLTLVRGSPAFGFPRVVRVRTPGHKPQIVSVGPGGSVMLRQPVVTRSARLDIVRQSGPVGPEAGRLLSGVAIGEIRVPGLRPPRSRRTGTFRSSCGAIRAVGRQAFANLAVSGAVVDMDAGRALDLRACGRSDNLQLAAGPTLMDVPPGPVFRPDYVRLSSPAPIPGPASAGTDPGRVVDQGTRGGGSSDAARLSVSAPAWLVLGESYSPGWRASCQQASGKERDLGAPVPIDGFANGWRVVPGCTAASFAFGPQGTANLAYWISLLAFIGMLLVLVLPWIRRRRTAGGRAAKAAMAAPVQLWEPPPITPARRYPLRVAIPAALVVGLVGGFVFAWRAGPPLALGTAVLMLVGVSIGRLLLLALYGLLVVPLLYLTDPLTNQGGANFGYAQHFTGAHWVAVAAVCVLLGALVLWLRELRTTQRSATPLDAGPGPP
jgi:hypothetical protein